MDWFKVESSLYDHPKIDGLTAGAFRALVFTWAYAARHETEGIITDRAARRVGLTARAAVELEERGLIHRNGAGWTIHDWDDHQADAAALKRIRQNARNRRQAHRDRQKGDANAT